MTCLGIVFFGFFFLGTLSAFEICRLCSLPYLGNFQPLFFKIFFISGYPSSITLTLVILSFWDLMACVLNCLLSTHLFLTWFIFFRFFIIIIIFILKECNLGVGIINCPFSFKSQFSLFCYDEQLFIITWKLEYYVMRFYTYLNIWF